MVSRRTRSAPPKSAQLAMKQTFIVLFWWSEALPLGPVLNRLGRCSESLLVGVERFHGFLEALHQCVDVLDSFAGDRSSLDKSQIQLLQSSGPKLPVESCKAYARGLNR